VQGKKNIYELFTPIMALNLFRKIPEQDFIMFNINVEFTRPSDFIITHIVAPPGCLRPSLKEGETGIRIDDLTVKLKDFLDRNKKIKMMIESGEEPSKISHEWFLFQCSYCHYLNSETPNLPFRDMNKKEKVEIRALA